MSNTETITEQEAMDKLKIASRMTIYRYTKNCGFPKPVRNRPKMYLLAEVDKWILNGGVNQKSS